MQEGVLGEARGLTVADVMDRQPVVLPAEATVQNALDEYFWRYRWPWFPVVDREGRFVGLIEQNAVERVDEGDRAGRNAGELVVPKSQQMSVRGDTPLTALLANQEIREHGSLMAVDGEGQLIGVVTIEQVQRGLREAIERATRRDPEPPPSDL
jgi:CBS domain-containing protein